MTKSAIRLAISKLLAAYGKFAEATWLIWVMILLAHGTFWAMQLFSVKT